VPAAFGAIAAAIGVTPPCVTSVRPLKTRYERPVPAAIGVAPLLKIVTTTGAAAPGKAALGMFGSMYGSLEEAVRHDRLYLALEALHDVVDPVSRGTRVWPPCWLTM
jgi:hypothetical protein